jgi:hypothetical protein
VPYSENNNFQHMQSELPEKVNELLTKFDFTYFKQIESLHIYDGLILVTAHTLAFFAPGW